MTITYLKGDATQPLPSIPNTGTRIITHVVNSAGGWGRGFVVAISRRWDAPERDYRQWYRSKQGFALGAVRMVNVEPELWVANIRGLWS